MSEQATFAMACEMALALPGVEAGSTHGTPSLRVGKKFMGRLWDDGDTLVMRVEQPEQDMLVEADPDVYFITDHYVGYPYILIRLSKIHPEDLRTHIERAWRLLATKRAVKEFDASR